MAFVANPLVPFGVGASIVDNNGNRSSVSFNVPSNLTPAEMSVWTLAMAALLPSLTDGYVEKVWQTIVYQNDAADLLNPTSEVERKLKIPLRGEGNIRGMVSIPSGLFSLESNYTDIVTVIPLSPLDLFITFLTEGTVGAENGAVSSTGGQFTALGGPVRMKHK